MEIRVLQSQNEVYSREKLLGEGAFGKAYLVKKKQTGELLVIKQMNIQHMSKNEKQQTIKQAQILRSLNHPNIVTFKQVYITKQNKLKIVMEYAENGDISKAINLKRTRKEYFEEGHILDWFTQICLAIKHVHDRKILHRDIKGQNIFIGANNTLKLGDFGIARVLNRTLDKARTVVGTPYYLSPEIIENKPYSFKSDIWSMGVVLYQLCALQPPFTANSLQFLALKIVKGSYPALQGNYSKEIKQLITQMLQIDPNKRPSVNEILKKPLIVNRIKNFLSETKRNHQFSHTVLHNQKVQISNKLVQIQSEKKLQGERMKLKEEELKMQKLLAQKKQMEKIQKDRVAKEKAQKLMLERLQRQKLEKQRENRRKQEEIRRKEEDKKKWLLYQKQKKQQMQREYDQRRRVAQINQLRKQKQRQQQRLISQKQYLLQQKYQLQEKKKKNQIQKKNQQKKKEQEKQKQKLIDFTRQQYFQNLQIRKMAEERAKRQQNGFQEKNNVSQMVINQQIPNYHQKRPLSKEQSRKSSYDKKIPYEEIKINKKDIKPTKQQKNTPSIIKVTDDDLMNVYANPNFGKKQKIQDKYKSQLRVPSGPVQRKVSNPNISAFNNNKQIQKQANKKKIEEARQQMKKDRQKFLKNKNRGQNSQNQINEQDLQTKQTDLQVDNYVPTVRGTKWQRPQSSEKKDLQKNQKQQPNSPRFGKIPNQKPQQSIIDSNNLFIDIKDQGQFDKYLEELQNIIGNVNKQIGSFPQIPSSQQIIFRDDDELQFSLTKNDNQECDTLLKFSQESANLKYFSDYSTLQTLRMQLEEAFGTQKFISMYRTIQKQIGEKGLQGFDMNKVVEKICKEVKINQTLIMQNIPLLLTLVAMEDKMSYS